MVHSCAVQADPLGGPDDDIPPIPDSLRSTPNLQLFFKKQPIELVFNEWVTLKNENQIIVSPPLEYRLNIKLKKKTLVIDFDEKEELLDSTTYTINLGESIVDYSVGNPMDNYTFVFSTGSFLDSLSISGKVTDDFTGEAVESTIVALYADLQDSAVYKKGPLYFTKTDENGRYKINNIRKDSFNLFALDDKNLNFYKDQESEKIGFYGESIFLDSSLNKLNFGIFQEQSDLRLITKKQSKGELILTFNQAVDSLEYFIEGGIRDLDMFMDKDTVYIWHLNPRERSLILDPKGIADTLILNSFQDSTIAKKRNSFNFTNISKASPLSPFDSIIMKFNAPIKSFDESKFSVIDSSSTKIKTAVFQNKKDPRILKIKARWIEGTNHNLEILPEAIETNLGILKDTIERKFGVNQKQTFGEIALELDSLNQEIWYLVEFSEGSNKINRIVKNKERYSLTLSGLKPGNYKVRVTEDFNKNGRWDSGNFFERRKSERWISKSLEPLKQNWTLDVKINGDEFE
jgi:hypothetical protein